MKRVYTSIIILLMIAFIGGCSGSGNGNKNDGSKKEKTSLQDTIVHNPLIENDISMESGQKVTWDCVWFGSYPQTEIVETDDYDTLPKEILLEGDYEVDAAAFKALEEAEGWSDDGDIELNGTRYRRTNSTEKIYGDQYNWDPEDKSYHYFRYDPIKWRVLEVDGDTALIMSDKVLDSKVYTESDEDSSWEASFMRSFLNEKFIDLAFSDSEKKAIKKTNLDNQDNPDYNTSGGNSTTDKIFVLSEQELTCSNERKYGFYSSIDNNDEARRCQSTTYAKAMNLESYDTYNDSCQWWIRTPGKYPASAVFVSISGSMAPNGTNADLWGMGCRPALRLNLKSSDAFKVADPVCSDEMKME